MDFDEFNVFLKETLTNLQNKYHFQNKDALSLVTKSLKLSEEVGEFSSDILKYLSFQRQEKLNDNILDEIEEEYADVVITASLILKELELNITEALDKKIRKITNRGGV